VAALVCALIALAALPALASAAEFAVDSTGDGNETSGCESPGLGTECTLRGAILAADLNSGPDVISFDSGVFGGAAPASTIAIGSSLPAITESVEMIAGRCPTGWGLEGPCVEVTGLVNSAGAGDVLTVNADGVSIEGLAIDGGTNGIVVAKDATGFSATNDWFGTGLNRGFGTGTFGAGIRLEPGADSAVIGGKLEAERDVFTRASAGIYVDGASSASIEGNDIGVRPDGAYLASTSLSVGVRIVDDATTTPSVKAEDDEVGGVLSAPEATSPECDGPCNVIATNGGRGIDLSGENGEPVEAASGPTTIRGNFIGLARDGINTAGDSEYGVFAGPNEFGCGAGPTDVTIGGTAPTETNYVQGGAIGLFAEGAENFRAAGNAIGIDADGGEGESPAAAAISVCAEGVTEAAHVEDNDMFLEPSAIGIESDFGHAVITGNRTRGGQTGVLAMGESEGAGDVIGSNVILEPGPFGVWIANQSNVVVGNTISGARRVGINLLDPADHNRIGGEVAAEENLIEGTGVEEEGEGAIVISGFEESRNEVAANHGAGNEGAFIQLFKEESSQPNRPNGGIQPPAFTAALQSSATGTAQPEAKVRIFSKASADAGELASLLAVVKADALGSWTATYATVPVGTLVAATQTSDAGTPEGGTSEVSAPVTAAADPVVPVEPGGGGSGGGSSGSGSSTPAPAPTSPKAPKVKITKGPAKRARSTTAKFKFTATPAAGAKFECKLDGKKFAKCASPKTYKNLKAGRHTFQVRAYVTGAPASKPVKFQFTIKP
jgi:hypothetical protein